MEFYQGDTVSESFQFLDPDGLNIRFTSGINEPTIGDIVRDGGTGTAKLVGILLLDGSWAAGDAKGKLYLANKLGEDFSAGIISVQGGDAIGTIAGNCSEYFNLTGYNILFTGKSDIDMNDDDAEFRCSNFVYPDYFNKITIDSATTGEIILELTYRTNEGGTQGKVGSYSYDFLIYYQDENDEVVDCKTLNQATITCKQDVTRGSGL